MDLYDIEDRVLLETLKKGNQLSFRSIYEKYSDQLFVYGYNILKDEDQCRDAVQDIFVWLWENRETLHITNLRSYLFSMLKFNLIWEIKKSKRRNELLSQNHFPLNDLSYDEFAIKELRQVISDFMDSLPPKAKEVFQLSRENYLSHRKIAEHMGISEHTVRNQLATTLKKFKIYLSKISYWTIILFFFK
ncbi:MAG: sigma-70 family RNA polymerase sigma factor [Sphingobacterium sp.]|jgi:RNA polymerase sigma-70 factor (ECF subfamily)|nr:sigma-70 family RNA polymerase sigma factor [Sphingobacterium sp.]